MQVSIAHCKAYSLFQTCLAVLLHHQARAFGAQVLGQQHAVGPQLVVVSSAGVQQQEVDVIEPQAPQVHPAGLAQLAQDRSFAEAGSSVA